MTEGIIDIVAVEKEIQRGIEREKKKADELIAEAKRRAEEDIIRVEEELKRMYEERLSAFDKAIREDASEIIERARRCSERINTLNDEELGRVIIRFIRRIIPDHALRDKQ